jgi:hypothetical protein
LFANEQVLPKQTLTKNFFALLTFSCCVGLYVRISNGDAVCNNERNFAQTSGISTSVLFQ